MVYLIHFIEKYKHAGHYVGYHNGSIDSLATRLSRHKSKQGARLLQFVPDWWVVRVWHDAGRDVERSLKNHSSTRECPLCTANKKKFLFSSRRKKLQPFVFLLCVLFMVSCSKEPPTPEKKISYFIKKTFSSDRTQLLQTDTLWTGPAKDIDTSGYPQWQYVCNPPTWEYYFIK